MNDLIAEIEVLFRRLKTSLDQGEGDGLILAEQFRNDLRRLIDRHGFTKG